MINCTAGNNDGHSSHFLKIHMVTWHATNERKRSPGQHANLLHMDNTTIYDIAVRIDHAFRVLRCSRGKWDDGSILRKNLAGFVQSAAVKKLLAEENVRIRTILPRLK